MELSALCLRCEVGDLLEDESCWNIFLACYNLYHITTGDKAYGLLRDTAGNTLAHIVLMLFSCPRVSRASVAAPPPSSALDEPARAFDRPELVEGRDTGRGAGAGHPSESSSAPTGIGPGGDGNVFADDRASPRTTSGFWRQGPPPRRDYAVSSEGEKPALVGSKAPPRVASEPEEEPWPSLDGAGEDAASRGVDGSVVVAGRGALKAMMGPGNGRFGPGGQVSPVKPRVGGSGAVGVAGGESASADGGGGVGGREGGVEKEGVLVKVMRFLSLLSDPRSNGSPECILSLSLINIALEAGGADLGRIPSLVRVMRGDLCKHLLQNSQTEDLDVLSLTLRVVFNLFNSIKDHLKVQLEVFLTR